MPRRLGEARLPVAALLAGAELVLEQRVVLGADDGEVVAHDCRWWWPVPAAAVWWALGWVEAPRVVGMMMMPGVGVGVEDGRGSVWLGGNRLQGLLSGGLSVGGFLGKRRAIGWLGGVCRATFLKGRPVVSQSVG